MQALWHDEGWCNKLNAITAFTVHLHAQIAVFEFAGSIVSRRVQYHYSPAGRMPDQQLANPLSADAAHFVV